jgi:hypothetical protein
MSATKTCVKCNIEKDFSEFPKRKDSKDGYRNDCKLCCSEKGKQSIQRYMKQDEREVKDSKVDVLYVKLRRKSMNFVKTALGKKELTTSVRSVQTRS